MIIWLSVRAFVLNWDAIDGAAESLGRNGVSSNYDPRYVEYTWETLHSLSSGATALFTQAPLPFQMPWRAAKDCVSGGGSFAFSWSFGKLQSALL